MATWDRVFWKDTAERVIATLAVTGISVFSIESIEKLADTNWFQAGWIVVAATGLTFCKCVLANVTVKNGAGFVDLSKPKPKEIVK